METRRIRRRTLRAAFVVAALGLATPTVLLAPSAAADHAPPAVPTDVRMVDTGPVAATVAWARSDGASDYVVRLYRFAHGIHYVLRSEVAEQNSHTIHDLFKNQDYGVSVSARGPAGTSAESEIVRFTTPDAPPPSTPENVRVSTAPGSVTVSWDSSTSEAGVRDYLVKIAGLPPWGRALTVDTTATIAVPPGGEHEVSVAARDTTGRWSASSAPVAFTLAPAGDWQSPSAPTNLRATPHAGGEEIVFAWDAPSSGLEPFTYRLHLDGTQIESTSELQLSSPYFAECSPGDQPLTFVVTATSYGVESPPSEPITLCFA